MQALLFRTTEAFEAFKRRTNAEADTSTEWIAADTPDGRILAIQAQTSELGEAPAVKTKAAPAKAATPAKKAAPAKQAAPKRKK